MKKKHPIVQVKPHDEVVNAELFQQILDYHWQKMVGETNIPSLLYLLAVYESMGIIVPELVQLVEKRIEAYLTEKNTSATN